MAYSMKNFEKKDGKVFCLCGDGEMSEGSCWEALNFAGIHKLDNLIAMVDVNRLGQSDPAPLEHDTKTYKARFEAFGFYTQVVDGHDVSKIVQAFEKCRAHKGQPCAIVWKTYKGHGFGDHISDKLGWHGKVFGDKTQELLDHLTSQLSGNPINLKPHAPNQSAAPPKAPKIKLPELKYEKG
jgi:transketolase